MGKPGNLLLTGNGAGTYDACPLYNIANFMPGETVVGFPYGLKPRSRVHCRQRSESCQLQRSISDRTFYCT